MGRMLELCQRIILERLNFLTKYQYRLQIESVISQSGSAEELHVAESLVKDLMKQWGECFIGGDLLTVERIDQNMSLRRSNFSEFGKCSFIGPSRIAIFHFRQNIVLKIFASTLPNLSDSGNPGSLNAFRALTDKAKEISNSERKIKDALELHYQFLMLVGETYFEEKLLSYAKLKYGASNLKQFASSFKDSDESELSLLLNEIIEDSNQTIFFEKSRTFDKQKSSEDVDDLQHTGDFFVSLWFLLRNLDFLTKSGDPQGIEYFKKNSLLLILSQHSTASKYVHKGFQEIVKMKSMSERSKLRFNSGSFVKFHGKQSSDQNVRPSDLNNRSEDMVCEWLVGSVKNSFRTLGGNYNEETIDKKVRVMSLVNSMLDHDNKSLLIESNGPGTSWERFDSEEVDRFRDYVHTLDPFRSSDRKRVVYGDRSIPRSLYSKLSRELIEKFFSMKLKNMQ